MWLPESESGYSSILESASLPVTFPILKFICESSSLSASRDIYLYEWSEKTRPLFLDSRLLGRKISSYMALIFAILLLTSLLTAFAFSSISLEKMDYIGFICFKSWLFCEPTTFWLCWEKSPGALVESSTRPISLNEVPPSTNCGSRITGYEFLG